MSAFLGVFLVSGCAARSSEEATRDALRWEAARSCESRFATIRVREIDHLGRLHFIGLNTLADAEPFLACYREEVARRTAGPPRR
jgi:hypothetical protein